MIAGKRLVYHYSILRYVTAVMPDSGLSPTHLSTQALPAGTRLEEFVIERVLGSGGFGVTYLAKDARLGREVVIKENLPVQFCFRDPGSLTVLPRHSSGPDLSDFAWSLENFEKEAAMLASLDHPGIVRVHRSFEALGTAYFVMPFVEGEALDGLIRSRLEIGVSFTEEEIRRMLKRSLDALDYLHARGIYHRDIKPGNVLIMNGGDPVLIDFGAARQRLSERSLTVVESPGYTPFEQLQSRGKVGPWSDLYALGGTLYKAITAETPPKATDRAFDDPLEPLAGREELRGRYSEALLSSIDRAMDPRIEGRFQEAFDWRARIAADFSGSEDSAEPADIAPLVGEPKVGVTNAVATQEKEIRWWTAFWKDEVSWGTAFWKDEISWGTAILIGLGVVVGIPLLPVLLVWISDFGHPPERIAGDPPVTSAVEPIPSRDSRPGPTERAPGAPEPPTVAGRMEGTQAGEERTFAGTKMIWCLPGEFLMGSPADETGRSENETQHRVTLTKGFWLAKTETTQGQWERLMGGNPSEFKGAELPVETVSWDDAQEYLVKMNSQDSLPSGWKWVLPSEAQWEYACRAGTETTYAGDLDEMAWYEENSGSKTNPVGMKKANAWGLYDMHGNVWEWCMDYKGEYESGFATDPTGVNTGGLRVNRGGSWVDHAQHCRSANRYIGTPGRRDYRLGFRPALVPSK